MKNTRIYETQESMKNTKSTKNAATMETMEIYPRSQRWKFIIQTLLAILSAIATSFGVSSCVAAL